jgi:hypothetical protein
MCHNLRFLKHYQLWFFAQNWLRYGQTQESGVGSGVGSGLIYETTDGKLLSSFQVWSGIVLHITCFLLVVIITQAILDQKWKCFRKLIISYGHWGHHWRSGIAPSLRSECLKFASVSQYYFDLAFSVVIFGANIWSWSSDRIPFCVLIPTYIY